jgi:hypothetical protein
VNFSQIAFRQMIFEIHFGAPNIMKPTDANHLRGKCHSGRIFFESSTMLVMKKIRPE